MKNTIIFSIASLFYVIILLIVFFKKRYFKTIESKLYSGLIITIFIELLVELSGVFILESNISWLIFVQMKLYQICLIVWIEIFMTYAIVVSHPKKEKRIKWFPILIGIVSSIIIFLLPTEIYNDGETIYTYGASINYVFIFSVICICIIIFELFKNIRRIFEKQYIPLFMFLLLGIVVMIVRLIVPGVLLISSIEAFITFLMYFALENPDIKIMKELRYSKALAEKSQTETLELLNEIQYNLKSSVDKLLLFGYKQIDHSNINELNTEMEYVQNSSIKIAEQITSVIDIAKLESGKYQIKNDKYETYRLLDEINQFLNYKMRINKVILKTTVDSDINRVLYGDSEKVKQTILYVYNYLLETIKIGTIELHIDSMSIGKLTRLKFHFYTESSEIENLISKNNDYEMELSIHDLNYEIIYRLLKLLDGKIEVKKHEDKFEIVVMIVQRNMSVYDTNSKVKQLNNNITYFDASDRRVIIVDNNLARIKEVMQLLKPYHINVTTSQNKSEFIEHLLKDEIFDLILVDDMLPSDDTVSDEDFIGMMKSASKLAKRTAGYKIPLVALITENKKNIERDWLKLGFDDFIIKPMNEENLSKIMNKYFNK